MKYDSDSFYRRQVQLLLQILPVVATEKELALKGGTAINMFVLDMPRLSVDIDLVYTGFEERKTALANISSALLRIKTKLLSAIPDIKVETYGSTIDQEEKLFCLRGDVQVKIEINTVMRGIIKPTRLMPVSSKVQKEFELFIEASVLSHEELFGGKICAAIDRQHPRDLFDIRLLLKDYGFTTDIKNGFIAALLSHPRSIHELLRPNFHNQKEVFESQFRGMAFVPFSYSNFESTRSKLLSLIHKSLTDQDKKFLVSFKSGEPNWTLIGIEKLQHLPAVQWKLLNIQKLIQANSKKHTEYLKKLEGALL